MMNILTFDLEEWFHILDHPEIAKASSWENLESRIERNTERILNVLESRKQRATWFCLGWIAKKYPSLIQTISANHEVACHSMEHALLYKINRTKASNDIRDNIHLLEDISGHKILSYRAPGFSFTRDTKWLVNVLTEQGIAYDCSLFPFRRNHGGYPGLPAKSPCRLGFDGDIIREFPMNASEIFGRNVVFSGGGYFRLLPYGIINRLMHRSEYVMTYFHPRDFDPGQPVLKSLSTQRRFMSYIGLKETFVKFNRLLDDHKFMSLDEAGRKIDWNSIPLIDLEKY